MAVTTCPNELTNVQVTLLCHHMGQQCITGDVEGHTQEDVGAALIELAAQLAATTFFSGRCHIELKEGVARHQGHLVEFGYIPGTHHDATRVWVGFELLHHFTDLVDVAAIWFWPVAPLHTVYRTQATVFAGPFVPDGAVVFLQPLHIAVATKEPQQLNDDGLQEDLLRGHQRKTFVQVKAHLVAEHTACTGAGAVALRNAYFEDIAHEVFVLGTDGARCDICRLNIAHACISG